MFNSNAIIFRLIPKLDKLLIVVVPSTLTAVIFNFQINHIYLNGNNYYIISSSSHIILFRE